MNEATQILPKGKGTYRGMQNKIPEIQYSKKADDINSDVAHSVVTDITLVE